MGGPGQGICLKYSWDEEWGWEVPAISSPGTSRRPVFPSHPKKALPKNRQPICRPQPGRWVEISGYSAGGEAGRSRGRWGAGAGEEGKEKGATWAASLPVAIKPLFVRIPQSRSQEIGNSRTQGPEWARGGGSIFLASLPSGFSSTPA